MTDKYIDFLSQTETKEYTKLELYQRCLALSPELTQTDFTELLSRRAIKLGNYKQLVSHVWKVSLKVLIGWIFLFFHLFAADYASWVGKVFINYIFNCIHPHNNLQFCL